MERFYIIWNPKSSLPPSFKHPSFMEAKTEAKRLARLYPDQEFHVMEHKGTAQKVDVQFFVSHKEEDNDLIPF